MKTCKIEVLFARDRLANGDPRDHDTEEVLPRYEHFMHGVVKNNCEKCLQVIICVYWEARFLNKGYRVELYVADRDNDFYVSQPIFQTVSRVK